MIPRRCWSHCRFFTKFCRCRTAKFPSPLQNNHRENPAFARVLRRPEYKAAIERGAVEIWMPRLDPAVAQEIEAKRLSFIQARDAISPKGRTVPPLAPFDRSRVRRFWDEMATDMEPIASWLPQT